METLKDKSKVNGTLRRNGLSRDEWRELPATSDQLHRLRRLPMRTERTFTVPVSRGAAERRLHRAAEGVGRVDLPPEGAS
jgi:hypothetical protein